MSPSVPGAAHIPPGAVDRQIPGPKNLQFLTVVSALRWWADLLDSRFRIPGTRIRFGIDPLLSLVPGLGDLASPMFAMVLVVQGLTLRIPKVVMLRMLQNALIDALIGAVPLVGNVGDIFWRANAANLALLERHARPGTAPTPADYVFVFGMAALFGMVVMLPLVLGVWFATSTWRWLMSHPQ